MPGSTLYPAVAHADNAGMTSKLVLGMAAGTSAAVGTAAVVGHGLTTPEVVAALSAAGAIAFVNFRQTRYEATPHTLSATPASSGAARISAPLAASMAAHPAGSARGAALSQSAGLRDQNAVAGHADAA